MGFAILYKVINLNMKLNFFFFSIITIFSKDRVLVYVGAAPLSDFE